MSGDAGTAVDLKPLDGILRNNGGVKADRLIPLLQDLQKVYGYLPRGALLEASRRTGIPASRMYGVATFYEQFHLAPRGRHTIKCCRGTACHVKAGAEVIGILQRALGLTEGGTTGDLRFTLETVACLGTCFLAPAMMVDDDYYGGLTPGKVESLLKRYE